ncbi:MAG: SIMPL domain-containing protein [Duncaniella sp.]|nr:SIMPL domain-containing protein [Duncaniella sp.]
MTNVLKIVMMSVLLVPMSLLSRAESGNYIEVTGSATVNIVPDRITVEVGMEEYYETGRNGDSLLVKLQQIEKDVRHVFRAAGVEDSRIIVADMGNYRNREVSSDFLMAKTLSATVSDWSQIERIADKLSRKGITRFNIAKIDNSEIEQYNRQGLKAALDAAREKAVFIAANEGLTIVMPCEIVENGPNYYDTPSFSNVAFDSGAGMENMRRIVRRYSVKVRYHYTLASADGRQ